MAPFATCRGPVSGAGRSVIALASRSELRAVLFRLSRNSAGLPSISSAAIRFSSSSRPTPAVTAWGSRPKAMIQMQRASNPLPAPAPERDGARSGTPGARCRLGRQTAVSSAAKNEDFVFAGGLAGVDHGHVTGEVADHLSIGERERLERLADQVERPHRISRGGLLRDEPCQIGYVFDPHS